jgi:hypothetical protein
MSTLNVDALVGNTSANAITVRGEGSATTSLQQGLVKMWSTVEMNNSNNIPDSFNSSGITDNGAGTPQFTFINNMAAAGSYVLAGAGDDATFVCQHAAKGDSRTTHMPTSSVKTRSRGSDASVVDGHHMVLITGDLA